MQRYIDNDNVMRTILREVMKECENRGIITTDACILLLMRLVILEPGKEFLTMTREQCQNSIDDVIELVLKKLSLELSASLLTIKLQSYFQSNFLRKEKIIYDHRRTIAKLTEPLMRELMENEVKEKHLLDCLYHKLVVAITLLSGLGNPTNRAVLCSASVALSSVFPINELPRFFALGKNDKERQIEELTHVVAGIRIFNYDTHKHSEGIDDLPSILREACIAAKESIENERIVVCNFIDLLCTFLNECYLEHPRENDPDMIDIVFHVPFKICSDNVEFFRDLLIAKRQMDVYLGQSLLKFLVCGIAFKTKWFLLVRTMIFCKI